MKHIYIFLCLFLLTGVVSADNIIVGAFGQKLGAVVDEKLEFVGETTTGALKYKFKPENPYPAFTDYFIYVTPASKTIFQILVHGNVDTRNGCIHQLEILKAVLKQKYQLLENDHSTYQIISSRRNRTIEGYCRFNFTPSRVVMVYTDEALSKKVFEEKVSLIDKSNF